MGVRGVRERVDLCGWRETGRVEYRKYSLPSCVNLTNPYRLSISNTWDPVIAWTRWKS